ncbi:hypothetical protein ARMGADRAFT_1037663 [Armillaria gallica]|uniref:Uncharacterized protein n=1 Tax=Armillaria gallica TaxID=47427 RepID=A0A2H3CKQ4_ARMGA|nr:hypothetical protein ARMGADRAFT_1037663 [Armillaria gallica]
MEVYPVKWISSVGGEVEVHGFPKVGVPMSPIFLGINILLSDPPGHCSFWSEDLSIDDGEVWPVIIEGAVGIERVTGASQPSVMVELEWVDEAFSEDSLPMEDEGRGAGVGIRGGAVHWPASILAPVLIGAYSGMGSSESYIVMTSGLLRSPVEKLETLGGLTGLSQFRYFLGTSSGPQVDMVGKLGCCSDQAFSELAQGSSGVWSVVKLSVGVWVNIVSQEWGSPPVSVDLLSVNEYDEGREEGD